MPGIKQWVLWAAAAAALAGGGCGGKDSGLPLASVSGVVRLNGEPLANAVVEFNPKEHVLPKSKKEVAQGGSVGVTDEEGNYKLRFNNQFEGAVVGEHTVRVVPVLDADEQEAKDAAAKKRDVAALTRVLQTQLSYEVQPGENTYDIELETR